MALGNSLARLGASKAKSKVVVLVTDGGNNAGEIDPDTAANVAKGLGIRVYTVGVGTAGGPVEIPVPVRDPETGRVVERRVMAEVDVDEKLLGRIAETTGGRFFRATDPAGLAETYAEIDRLEKTEVKTTTYTRWRETFPRVAVPAARRPRGGRAPRRSSPSRWRRDEGALPLPRLARRRARRGALLAAVARVVLGPPAPRRRRDALVAPALAEKAGLLSRDRWTPSRRSSPSLVVLGTGLALARPRWGLVTETVERRGADVVVVLDTSASMRAADVTPSRFVLARQAALSLAERLPGDRLALVGVRGGGAGPRPAHARHRRRGALPRGARAGDRRAARHLARRRPRRGRRADAPRDARPASRSSSSPTARTSKGASTRRSRRRRARGSSSTPSSSGPQGRGAPVPEVDVSGQADRLQDRRRARPSSRGPTPTSCAASPPETGGSFSVVSPGKTDLDGVAREVDKAARRPSRGRSARTAGSASRSRSASPSPPSALLLVGPLGFLARRQAGRRCLRRARRWPFRPLLAQAAAAGAAGSRGPAPASAPAPVPAPSSLKERILAAAPLHDGPRRGPRREEGARGEARRGGRCRASRGRPRSPRRTPPAPTTSAPPSRWRGAARRPWRR